MSILNTLLSIIVLLTLVACQVSEPKANGGLISGHVPASNKFTLQGPSAKTHIETESVSFVVTFPFDMIIDTSLGDPRLSLKIGGSTKYTTYVPGTNLRNLNFTYEFIAGDNDSDGIDVVALELNGSTLKFDQSGTITNCDIASITTTNFLGANVDTAAPTITSFNLINVPGLYHPGDKLNFVHEFSEKVFVTGTPTFTTTLGATPVDVDYVSGSGSKILSFSYTITSTDVSDGDGLEFPTPVINVGAGSIKDAVGNDAVLDFTGLFAAAKALSVTVKVNGKYPYVVDIQAPANGTYLSAQVLEFTLEFDKNVTVSGVPYLTINVGPSGSTTTRNANYVSGSTTKFLKFRYTTVPGDVDPDGIDILTAITQNGGNITATGIVPAQSFFTDPINRVLLPPDMQGIILNSVQPQPITIARNIDTTSAIFGTALDNVWNIGQELKITVGFNTNMFVNTTIGTPTLEMTIGAVTKYATYLSGGDGQTSLIFTYSVVEGDLDTDGDIALGNIVLNGATIADASNTLSLLTMPAPQKLTTTKIDGVRPTILSVTPPVDKTYSNLAGSNHVNMEYTVTWSEAVNYSSTTAYFEIDIGGTLKKFIRTNNNLAGIFHGTDSLALLNDLDGVSIPGTFTPSTTTIKDAAGNTATVFTYTTPPVATPLIFVDTTAAKVVSITPQLATTPDGKYKKDDELFFEVTFDESVTINKSATYPRIQLDIGGNLTNYAVATANGTGLTHIFSYTIPAGKNDTDGIIIKKLFENSGAFAAKDTGLNLAIIDPAFVQVSTGIIVDTTAPNIISTTSSPAGTYVAGDTLQITLTYDEAVTVTGNPTIALDFTEGTDNLDYVSGDGTTTLTFERTLDATHFHMKGWATSITLVDLSSGATLKDEVGNTADDDFSDRSRDFSKVYVTYPEVKLWVKKEFVNLAPGAITVSNTGAVVSTVACKGGTCRDFNDDAKLTLNDPMNNIEHLFMVFKTPQTLDDYNLFGPDVGLVNDTSDLNFDLTTNPSANLTQSSENKLYFNFAMPKNFTAGEMVGSSFNAAAPDGGAIGEIIAVETGINPTKLGHIQTYFNQQYPLP